MFQCFNNEQEVNRLTGEQLILQSAFGASLSGGQEASGGAGTSERQKECRRNVSPLWQCLHMKLNHCWTQSPSLQHLVLSGPPLCPPRAGRSSGIYMSGERPDGPVWWRRCVPTLWAPAALPQQGAAPPQNHPPSVFSRRSGPEEETCLRPHTAGRSAPPGGLWMLLGTRSPRASPPSLLKFDSSNKQHRHIHTVSSSFQHWKLHGPSIFTGTELPPNKIQLSLKMFLLSNMFTTINLITVKKIVFHSNIWRLLTVLHF